jgi:hypothetical protein
LFSFKREIGRVAIGEVALQVDVEVRIGISRRADQVAARAKLDGFIYVPVSSKVSKGERAKKCRRNEPRFTKR